MEVFLFLFIRNELNSISSVRDRVITLRSVVLGLLGTLLICVVTPYNDYALNNTPMVGNNLPAGAILFAFIFAIFINGPLSRFLPRIAFTSGEMVVSFSMMLVACSIPSAGLLRYLPPMLVAPYYKAADNQEFRAVIESLDLPKWMFPTYKGDTPGSWINDPLANGYMTRWVSFDESIPYSAWLTPIFTWAIFIFALYGALLCIVTLVRRQWVENERLSFPLAQIQLALVEQPEPGRALNSTFRNGFFWIAFSCVFLIHINNGLANYLPGYVPRIPMEYNLIDMMSDSPWAHARVDLKQASVYFIVIGATYFIPSSIAFSLWFFFVLEQIFAMTMGSLTGEAYLGNTLDQHNGSIFAFALAVFFVGRHHWWMILKQAFRGHREGEPQDSYLPYPIAFWGLVTCIAIMIGWMFVAGCGLVPSVIGVLSLILFFIVITRIVAEVGIIHGMLVAHLTRPWELLAMYGLKNLNLMPLKSMWITGTVDGGLFDFREVTSVYASHGLKLSDQVLDHSQQKRHGRKFIGLLALALVVGYFSGFFSTIYTEYNFWSSAEALPVTPINGFGTGLAPNWFLLDPAVRYKFDYYTLSPDMMHNPLIYIVIGFVVTLFLAAMRLRFAWWPLHPVGYLMLGTFPGCRLWFSIMLGWMLKTLIVRFGGSKLYLAARPFFLGLIVGESLAAGFWMFSGIILYYFGYPYRPIVIMPG